MGGSGEGRQGSELNTPQASGAGEGGEHFRVLFLVFKTKMNHWVVSYIPALHLLGGGCVFFVEPFDAESVCSSGKIQCLSLTYPNRLLVCVCVCVSTHSYLVGITHRPWSQTACVQILTLHLINSMSYFSYFIFLTLYFLICVKLS